MNERRDLWLTMLHEYREQGLGLDVLPDDVIPAFTDPTVLGLFWLEACRRLRDRDRADNEYEERTGRTIR